MVKRESVCIREEVWEDNLDEEIELMREVVDEYHYHTLKSNVDNLKLTQLGLTFLDEERNIVNYEMGHQCVWKFNLREFNPNQDIHAPNSNEL